MPFMYEVKRQALDEKQRQKIRDALKPHAKAEETIATGIEELEFAIGHYLGMLNAGGNEPEKAIREQSIAELERLQSAIEAFGSALDGLSLDAVDRAAYTGFGPDFRLPLPRRLPEAPDEGTAEPYVGVAVNEVAYSYISLAEAARAAANHVGAAIGDAKSEPNRRGPAIRHAENGLAHRAARIWEAVTGRSRTFWGGSGYPGPFGEFLDVVFEIVGAEASGASHARRLVAQAARIDPAAN